MSRPMFTFVTGNANKLREVRQIFSQLDVKTADIDLPEYQGTPEEIATKKCTDAAAILKGPVLVEDTSLGFNAMGGLPGPYIKWFLKELTIQGIPKMLAAFEDKSAVATCVFAYTEGPEKPVELFIGKCEGQIVEPRGPTSFGWDPCFLPNGFDKTYSELDSTVKNSISHRGNALKALATAFNL